MTDNFKDTIGIAIDGGGVKGTIVAYGIMALEKQLGVNALIESPRVQVLAGTSTGSLISTMLAAGFTGQEILDLYNGLSEKIFSQAGRLRPGGKTLPIISHWDMPVSIQKRIYEFPIIGQALGYILFPARYAHNPLRQTMLKKLAEHPIPNENPTLREVGQYMETERHSATIIITATEVSQRKTHFLKTNSLEKYQDMKLVDAMLASSSIPSYWEPIPLNDPKLGYQGRLVDGGVGSFGNPALIAAWELCDPRNPDPKRHHNPKNTTIISFGTGTYTPQQYHQLKGDSQDWWALTWASRLADVFGDMAIREQSRNIVATYRGIDLRRYQVSLPENVAADNFDLVPTLLRDKGLEMQKLIEENRHALHQDPTLRNDPEGIWHDYITDYL